MARQELEPEKYNPDDNLKIFATQDLVVWLVVALVIHLMVIGGTSVGYVMQTVFKTEDAQQEQVQDDETATEGEEDEAEDAGGDEDDAKAGDETAENDAENDAADKPDSEKTHDELIKERQDSEVVQETRETADPEEIPDNPEDIPISIDETNE